MAQKNNSLIPVLAAAFLILVFTFLNGLPVLSQMVKESPRIVSFHVSHWPGDYFYYLSQFTQGENSWFLSSDLYTSNFYGKTAVGWINVFIGRLFHIMGAPSEFAYHASNTLFVLGFLSSSFYLLVLLFGDKKNGKAWALVSFVLFLFSNAFPKVSFLEGKLDLWFYDHWFNIALPFTRLGGVPHQILERTLIIVTLILFLKNISSRRKMNQKIVYPLSILIGFVLAGIEPVHFLLTACVLSVSSVVMKKNRIFSFVFLLGGIGVVVYLKQLFSFLPYIQLVNWEASQPVSRDFFEILLSSGPLLILAVLYVGFYVFGLKNIIRAKKEVPEDFPFVVYFILSLGLFFSFIPGWIKVNPIRFLPGCLPLFWAYFSVRLFDRWKWGKKITIPVIALILAVMIPPLIVQIRKANEVDTSNLVYFIPAQGMDLYQKIKDKSSPTDVFLVYWPFNSSFPAYTGRRVFQGHPLLTIDNEYKEKKLFEFFDGKMSEEQAKLFLHDNGITQVVGYSGNRVLQNAPYLIKREDNGYLTWYEVQG